MYGVDHCVAGVGPVIYQGKNYHRRFPRERIFLKVDNGSYAVIHVFRIISETF